MAGVQQWPYKAVGKALEVIPCTLIQNCGASTIRILTQLRVSGISCSISDHIDLCTGCYACSLITVGFVSFLQWSTCTGVFIASLCVFYCVCNHRLGEKCDGLVHV